jgi:hypothetical protein
MKFYHANLRQGAIQVSEHKTLEWQFEKGDNFANEFFELSLAWTRKRDHAGPDFTFSIFKLFWINVNISDHRHWNYKKDRWHDYKIDGEEGEDND